MVIYYLPIFNRVPIYGLFLQSADVPSFTNAFIMNILGDLNFRVDRAYSCIYWTAAGWGKC